MKTTWIFAIAASALLVACNPAAEDEASHADHMDHASHEDHADHVDHDHAEHDHSDHDMHEDAALIPDESGFGIAKMMIRTPPGGRDVTGGYFDIVSASDDAIIGASSEAFSSIELHTHLDEDGVMVMKKLDDVPLKAGEVVSFKPKGLHLMLFGADGLELDQTVEVTFEFASGRTLIVDFPVQNLTIQMNHAH